MTKFTLVVAAALLSGTALPALAQSVAADTGAAQRAQTANAQASPDNSVQSSNNNAQAGTSDTGNNAAPNMAQGNARVATNMATNSGMSSDASPTQRKGMHLSASQRSKADAAEAQTTKMLNQQATAQAAPSGSMSR